MVTMDRRDFLKLGGAAAVAFAYPERGRTVSAGAGKTGWFDVRTFGAKGDGATDDTRAFKSALQAAHASGGGVVWVPPGVYPTSTLLLHGGIILQGAGWQSIIRLRPSANAHLIQTPPNQANYYAVIRDLCLDGNRQQNSAGDVLHLFSANSFRVEGVRIVNGARHGISLSGTPACPTIAPWILNSCIVKCAGNGIDVTGLTTDCKIHGVDIGWCNKGLILPSSSFLSDVTIWQCDIGLMGYWAANAHLHQVRTERCVRSGFWLEGCTDLSIEQCRAYENNQGTGQYHGFHLVGTAEHPCLRISFVGCTAGLVDSEYEKQGYGFYDGGSEHVDYVLSHGCTALGNRKGGYMLAGGKHNVCGPNM
jgi:hypothetical protein